jgi:chromosome segregation ATPase
MGLAMNLMMQLQEDYRELEQKVGDLERLLEATRIELTSRIDELRTERDRLKQENLQLRRDVQLWRTRHDDLARE